MKNETIVDRVVERLKTQPLGDLITEEDLHDIVKQAIPKAFFERRVTYDNTRTYNNVKQDLEPLIVEIMRELLRSSAQKAVNDWLVKNADIVSDHWVKIIDQGLLKYVQDMQNELATAQVKRVVQVLLEPINNERSRQGLSQIYL